MSYSSSSETLKMNRGIFIPYKRKVLNMMGNLVGLCQTRYQNTSSMYGPNTIAMLDHKGSEFTLSFLFRTPENSKAISYIAFTYPFSYTDLQNYLKRIDAKLMKKNVTLADDIYYHRECAIMSLEGLRLDLLTISSHHNISTEREAKLKRLFPIKDEERPFKFRGKKIIFISARVHPGETPSSFVFNGFLNFLLNREDPIAINLRRSYVFKMIPMLNPDGVARGHYRMDTRGVNLNRVYLNPSFIDHPTIYAARVLILYHHHFYQVPDEIPSEKSLNINLEVGERKVNVIGPTGSLTNVIRDTTNRLLQQVTLMTLDEKGRDGTESRTVCELAEGAPGHILHGGKEQFVENSKAKLQNSENECNKKTCTALAIGQFPIDPENSGLYLYIDLHGHASKKGVFMYGNHFDNAEDTVMCMLLPKLMSLNNPNFHFTSCNFAERNMYLIDKRDGMSREGSGRVAVYKLTGLVRSYTLECNYNSGRMVNSMPARVRDGVNKTQSHMFVPPKYTPTVFEEVGAALGPSILDLTTNNPNSRLPNSQYRSLRGVRSYLKLTYVNLASSFNRPLSKGSGGVDATNQRTLDTNESKMNSSTEDCSTSVKSGIILAVKTNRIRRASLIYTNFKRIACSRKTRPVSSNRMLKNQDGCKIEDDNLSSGARLPSAIAVRKKLLKSVDHIPSITSNVANIRSTVLPKLSTHKRSNRQLTLNNFKHQMISEKSLVLKHKSERPKAIPSKKFAKTRPEIGESSKSTLPGKVVPTVSSRAFFLCNKQNNKNIFGRVRKPFIKIEQIKSKKSSKLKLKGKNSLLISKLSGNEDSSGLTE
ncbi:cytosolic carboxypeptidase-like protein 5 isoform X2 [Athalia rosae]|uniref:cytosolic carboxypeptidase-like protein 5 isoform X2 n=1 Tax=Athalia rosae TaxID=37344 RepID=UPI0020332E1F|nr:cytosolic carboxypeptidase-like protein 5 isoform X2 [Athalia rosae]